MEKCRLGSIWLLLGQLVGHPAIGSRSTGGGGDHRKAEAFQTAGRSEAGSVVTTAAAVGGRGVVLRGLAQFQSCTSGASGARETEQEVDLEEGMDGLGRNEINVWAVVQFWKQIATEGNRGKTCINIEKLSGLEQLRPNVLGEARLRREGGLLEARAWINSPLCSPGSTNASWRVGCAGQAAYSGRGQLGDFEWTVTADIVQLSGDGSNLLFKACFSRLRSR